MAYDVNFTSPNYKLQVKCMLHYIGHHSSLSFGVVGYDFDYDLGPVCVGEIDSTK